jgi:zinc transporter, ZIP family
MSAIVTSMQYDSHAVLIAFAATFAASLATILGSLSVVKADRSSAKLLAFGLAFAGGAMVYISFVEIFQKSVIAFKHLHTDKDAYGLATLFFFIGIGLLVVLDRLVPNPHVDTGHVPHDSHKKVARVGLMATLAITAHNFPEGAATFFATLDDPIVGAPLAAAIAIHNIPEGISIAIPVYYATGSRLKALWAVSISAMAEPVGALIAYGALAPFLSQGVFGGVFGIIAGAMVFLALDELLPAAKKYATGHETVYGMVSGMAVLALSLVLFR